jgi:hypothetical protein
MQHLYHLLDVDGTSKVLVNETDDMGLNPQSQQDKPSSLKSYNTRKMTPKFKKIVI